MGRGVMGAALQIGVIVASAVVFGVVHNAMSDGGISLSTPATSQPETAIQWSLHLEGIRTTLDQAKQDYDRGAVFVDVRPSEDYVAGHIPGALHLEVFGFADRMPGILGDVSRDTRIVAYCAGGSCQSSTKMARLLMEQGFTDVGCFYTGWQAWMSAGYPVAGGSD